MKKRFYLGTHAPHWFEEYDTFFDAKEAAESFCVEYEINSCLIGESDTFYPKVDAEWILENHADEMYEGFLGIYDCLGGVKMDELNRALSDEFKNFMIESDLGSYFGYVKAVARYERNKECGK